MTQQQPYRVVATYPGFEVRRFDAHMVAEVSVAGGFESAGNRAFGALVRYIGGRNKDNRGMAMTAPVVQVPAVGHHVVQFVMPADETASSLPDPADPRVGLRAVPAQLAAVVRYSGRWSEGGYRDRVARLEQDVAAAGFTVAGPARWARFDPPWTPWFMRRNEVVLPVTGAVPE